MRGRLAYGSGSGRTVASFAELAKIKKRTTRHNTMALVTLVLLVSMFGAAVTVVVNLGSGAPGPLDAGGCNGGQVGYFHGGQPVGSTPLVAVRLWAVTNLADPLKRKWVVMGDDALRSRQTYVHVAKDGDLWQVDEVAQCPAA